MTMQNCLGWKTKFHLIKHITQISENTQVSLQAGSEAAHLLFVQDALI